MTADLRPEPRDADRSPSPGVADLMGLLPSMQVDLNRFMRTAAFQGAGEGPAVLEVRNDAGSRTRLRFTLWWTDGQGKRVGVTSAELPRMLWQAAALERQATVRRRRKFLGQLEEEEE